MLFFSKKPRPTAPIEQPKPPKTLATLEVSLPEEERYRTQAVINQLNRKLSGERMTVIARRDGLGETIAACETPEQAAELVNHHLAARGLSHRLAPVEPTLGAEALVHLAREYTQLDLVPALLDEALTEAQARERFAIARELQDRLAAGGVSHLLPGIRAALMSRGPVDAICYAIGARLEAAEAEIRSDHTGGWDTAAKPGPGINALEIQERRKAAAAAKEVKP